MATTNPNSFDYFRNNEVFTFIKGKHSTNEMDLYRKADVFPAIFIQDVVAHPATVTATRDRFFIID